jgi:hypothetical protein
LGKNEKHMHLQVKRGYLKRLLRSKGATGLGKTAGFLEKNHLYLSDHKDKIGGAHSCKGEKALGNCV